MFEESVDTIELVVAVLRDEERAPRFGWCAPAAVAWLLDDDVFDRSIGDTAEVAAVADVADSVQDVQEQAVTVILAEYADEYSRGSAGDASRPRLLRSARSIMRGPRSPSR
ncbi:hypothetical protein PQR64_33835 [Paraburkholderia phytofirmans]|uniref:hypothetical protein n=1 Tax=Paraburkholderia phytofirmans TaxID=261302 RepID=UPI0038BA6A09